MDNVYSYATRKVVRWGDGNVVFLTKEVDLIGLEAGDQVNVTVVEEGDDKVIMIKRLPVEIKKGD